MTIQLTEIMVNERLAREWHLPIYKKTWILKQKNDLESFFQLFGRRCSVKNWAPGKSLPAGFNFLLLY